MATEYRLNNTGPELQELLNQVPANKEAIGQETQERTGADTQLREDLSKYADEKVQTEQKRADGVEKGLQESIDGAKGRIDAIEKTVGEGGSIDNRIKSAINALDATAGGSSADGKVTVNVTEVDGKVIGVSVATNDVASASDVANKMKAVNESIEEIKGGSTDSIKSLKESIENEKTERETKDKEIDKSLSEAKDSIKELEENLDGVVVGVDNADVHDYPNDPYLAMIEQKGNEYGKKLEESAQLFQNILDEKIPESGSDVEIDAYPTEESGKMVSSGGVHKALEEVKDTYGRFSDNSEYIRVITDSDGRLLFGIKIDGSIDWAIGVPKPVKDYINDALKEIGIDYNIEIEKIKDEINAIVDEALKKFSDVLSVIDDVEDRVEMTTDDNGKIISHRDKDGVLHENVGVETPVVVTDSLHLSDNGMNEFQKALKDAGFQPGGTGDWSDYISNDGDSPLCIPEPRCAMINITNDNGDAVWPTSKTANYEYYMEFWDMQGNYFKKKIILNAQGNSSLAFIKKNGGFDLFDSEWGEDSFKVKFGNWPAMDSYHLKAYYTDFFRGAAISAYKLAIDIDNTYPISKNSNWKKALLKDYDFGTCTSNGEQLKDMSLQVDTGGLCMPDGFPCIVYLNGEFYGVYSFNIKKARENYHMNKNNPKHIHLDGTLNGESIFINPNSNYTSISWGSFEIRNPKNLVYATAHDGTYKYDADLIQANIAGNDDGSDTYDSWVEGSYPVDKIVLHNGHYYINTVEGNNAEPIYDKSKNADDAPDFKNKTGCGWINCTNTIKVKNSIIQFSKYWKAIHDKSSPEERKAELEKYFDVNNLIDYYIVQLVTGDSDGFGKNWQWTTWDGTHWYVNEYDKDMVFGNNFTGTFTMPPFMSWVNNDYRFNTFSNVNSSYLGIMPYVYNYYMTEVKARYKVLRDTGIINPKVILNKTLDWLNRIGKENLEKEYDKWPNSPCNNPPVLNNGWAFYNWESLDEYKSISTYDDSTAYKTGDKCKYNHMCFIATDNVQGVVPSSSISHADNIYRLANWIEERIALEDSFLEYNNN